jgi:MoaA/NifB/PqqE/SkfB family radical SAM enzyme
LPLKSALDRLYPEGERRPMSLTAELTYRCNFRCGHCFCCLPAAGPLPRAELSTSDWERILGESAELGVLFALLTGGEALLREDFRRIWMFAKRQGLLLELFSNGSLIDAEAADFLAEWTPQQVSVTLYGASENVYRAMTGCEGMHARVMRSLDLLAERGVKVEVKSIVTRLNVHEIEGMRAQSARYQEKFLWDAQLIGCYAEGGGDPLALRLTPAEIVRLEQEDALRWSEWQRLTADWEPMPPNRPTPFFCAVGRRSFHVNPYGRLEPCLSLDTGGIDLRQASLAEAWDAVPRLCASVAQPEPGPCQSCALPGLCDLCPAAAQLAGGRPGSPLPWYCELGCERAKALGIEQRPAGD